MPQTIAPSVVAPGNHDGVHLGHRALIEAARRHAAHHGCRVVALTFDPHPVEVLAPGQAPPQLTTPERRAELLRAVGADDVIVQRFDVAFSRLSPQQFVQTVLVDRLHARAVVVGPDFRFGAERAGDIGTLRELGARHGYDVELVERVECAGERVSSSRVRELLGTGDVKGVARLLGRWHDLSGLVVEGDRRGRTLGFATANLRIDDVLPPADGVYAVVVRQLDPPRSERWHGVANIGTRPTFDAGRAVEVHLLDVDEELYGARLRVGFVDRLRGEQRFQDVDALRRQIRSDVDHARDSLRAVEEGRLSWI